MFLLYGFCLTFHIHKKSQLQHLNSRFQRQNPYIGKPGHRGVTTLYQMPVETTNMLELLVACHFSSLTSTLTTAFDQHKFETHLAFSRDTIQSLNKVPFQNVVCPFSSADLPDQLSSSSSGFLFTLKIPASAEYYLHFNTFLDSPAEFSSFRRRALMGQELSNSDRMEHLPHRWRGWMRKCVLLTLSAMSSVTEMFESRVRRTVSRLNSSCSFGQSICEINMFEVNMFRILVEYWDSSMM